MASWWTAFWTVAQRASQRAILGTASTKLGVYAPGQRPKPQFYGCLCACSTLALRVTLLAVTALEPTSGTCWALGAHSFQHSGKSWDVVGCILPVPARSETFYGPQCTKKMLLYHTEKCVIPILQRVCRKPLSLG